MTCVSCGATAPAEARFCPSCGSTLVTRPDERRIATVLFADLVGFTGFSESADPEHVKNLVDRCFERLVTDVTAFGGQVDKILGDAIVALFGAPVAHEDDAERAVRAALQMQRTLGQLRHDLQISAEMRVGVNTGEVLVGALRAGGDYTAMGDVVNTASRLQSLARPGQVIVGRMTHEATHRAVRYEPLGALVVKGREGAVEAWAAQEVVAPPGQRPRHFRAPLIGREVELALLRRLLDAALARERAHLVLLLGEAGVGKSRVAVELAELAREERGALVLRGPCLPYGEANVWWPVAEALRHLCGIDPNDTGDARAVVEAVVAEAVQRDENDAQVERIADGLLYLLGRLEERTDVDPARARDDALWSVNAFFEAFARRQPMVLVLSDLHWADDAVLELVDRLMARLRGLPFVLLATARPDLEERWSPAPGRHNVAVLHLDPLDVDATADLVREHLGEHAPPELVDVLRDRSGGNPFFIEELSALIRESGGAPDVEAVRALVSGELPVTLRGLVAARLDALTPAERASLEDCAVIGSSGPVEAILALGDTRSSARPDHTLTALVDRDLVVIDEHEFAFRSELTREVAYGTLTKAERARRHATLACWLADRSHEQRRGEESIDRLAHHYAVAAELVRELGQVDGVPADLRSRAVEVLEHAAQRAEAVEAWPRAERRYDQALAVLPEGAGNETRWRLRLGAARALVEQRKLPAARPGITEMLEQARASGDRRTTAHALTLLADLEQKEGDLVASEATFGQAVEAWRALGDMQGVADALRGSGMTLMFRDELDKAQAAIDEALRTFRELGDRRGEAWALQNLAWIAFNRTELDDAEQRINESAAAFAEIGDWGGLGWALGLLAFVRFSQGHLVEAAEIAESQLHDFRDSGNRWANGMLFVLLANVAVWTGRPALAIERAQEARKLFREIGDRWGQVQSLGPAARALGCLGRIGDAEALRREVAAIETPGDQTLVDLEYVVAGGLAAHIGDGEAALREFGRVAVDPHAKSTIGTYELAVGTARALLQRGEVQAALDTLPPSTGTAHEEAELSASGGVHAMILAAAGKPDDAVALTDQVVTLEVGSYLDRLEAWAARILALAQLGDETATRHAIEQGLALADSTESPLDQALLRLAQAHALEALGTSDASTARSDARRRLDALGLPVPGWEVAFRLAASGDHHRSPRDASEVA